MHRLSKTKLKQYMNVHKQMSMELLLQTFFYYNSDSHIVCLPHNEEDTILFVSKKELGHVVAYSKDGGEYNEISSKVTNKKWDYVIVEFESDGNGWSVARSNRMYGKISQGKKLLTMHDRNFILAKACQMIEPEELKNKLQSGNEKPDQNDQAV